MVNQSPEQIARDKIDAMLKESGWVVQSAKKIDFGAGLGIAVRKYHTDAGPVDYALFVAQKAVGVIEAKPEDWSIESQPWNKTYTPDFLPSQRIAFTSH